MDVLSKILLGGFMKGYRTQVLGVSAFVSFIVSYLVGDMTLTDLIKHVPDMLIALGITALGAKVNTVAATGKDN